MIRILFFVILSFSIPILLKAQQTPQYTLFAFNQHAYNPGYAGVGYSLEATAVFRKQWLGLEGSPMTQNLNLHLPLNFLSSGVGVNIENEFIGAIRQTKASLSYAYHLGLKNTKLSFGIAGGLNQIELDGTKLLAPDGEYNEINVNHNDLFLPETRASGITYNIDAGIYLQVKNFDFGISALHLTKSTVDYSFSELKDFTFARHFLGFASYKIDFNNSVTLAPSILFKTDLIENQIDFFSSIELKDQFLLGVGYRRFNVNSQDAFNLAGGLKISRNWQILYSYDISLSSLKQVNKGSHEVLLKYDLNKEIGKGRLPKIIHNPRLL